MTVSESDNNALDLPRRLPRLFTALICLWIMQCDGLYAKNNTAMDMDGADIFLVYCAGCHGFDGFAAYPPAPSFAMGDRLQQDDQTLLQSVLKGKGGMPPWQDKLSETMLRDAIAYLRTMAERRRAGLEPRTRPIPDTWFKFRPIGSRDPYGQEIPQP